MRRLAIIGTSLIGLALTNCADDEQVVESPPTASVPAAAPLAPAAPPEQAKAPEPTQKASSENEAYVATELLNVRSGPGVSHKVVGEIQFGSKVSVMKKGEEWIQIGEGQFVYGQYLSDTKLSSPIENPIVVSGQ